MDAAFEPVRLTSASGCAVELNANGSVRRFDCGAVSLTLFVGSEIEGGPTNLYLRRLGDPPGRAEDPPTFVPLLGPRSCTRWRVDAGGRLSGTGSWGGIEYVLALRLAQETPAWFWHVQLRNTTTAQLSVDLTYAQDVALAPYGAVRMNEYYVSQYVDHTPLVHATHGVLIASRQNQAVDGCHPWSLIASLRAGASYATDALQWYGLSARTDAPPPGLLGDLPDRRLQHEHSMVIVRDTPIRLGAGQSATGGFAGLYLADHPQASAVDDPSRLDGILALPEAGSASLLEPALPAAPPAPGETRAAAPLAAPSAAPAAPSVGTLFTSAPLLRALELDESAMRALFPGVWRHEERDTDGARLSFFHGIDAHVVLRAKELRTRRPHGQLLRTGLHLTPDETALTSTVWMGGVFHSMVTQGHVSINRFLSATHSYLGLFRAQGQRVFVQLADEVDVAGAWQLLGVPSAFEMTPEVCRWIYRHADGVLAVTAGVQHEPHALTLSLEVLSGAAVRCLIVHHVALNGDDGMLAGPARWHRVGDAIELAPAPGSELARRFPDGSFRVTPHAGTRFERVGGDELLYADGHSRQQPYLCMVTAPARLAGLQLHGQLITPEGRAPLRVPQPLRVSQPAELRPVLALSPPQGSPLELPAARLAEITPWLAQNAWVHYLAPRGLEQYTGGGWGTRDVCQGPAELLLALGRTQPLRDVLLRVMAQQNRDGDWPQWFMFFERESAIRAGDSHGDVVLWPLVVLAQYLIASGDAGVLDQRVGFGGASAAAAGEMATVWEHAQRALALTQRRAIAGTALLAYGHGDWNDSLQPLDARMREHLCSAWTVTLHVQALRSLAQALQAIGRDADAVPLRARAVAVEADFQRLLLVDGVLAGYALFEQGQPHYLLHPRDQATGVHYSSLAMIHAILEDLLTPQQARSHLALIEAQLTASDGLRLFDQPLPYRGGPQHLFQRAESATFFGREIGLMYMHAHLRYAQALAHLGEADRFFHALCQANPIGIRSLVPGSSLRQANCYYSSSDAAFDDRYQASAQYARVRSGTIAFDGGWRVYSSGAGIAVGLIMRRFLGLSLEAGGLRVDPVVPSALSGLRAELTLRGRVLEVLYRVGSAGCGVQSLQLNGAALPFERLPNPHRPGAALVAAGSVEASLRERNLLEVQLG